MLLIVSLLIDSKKGGELWFLFVLCIGSITFQWQAVIRNHADILFAMLLNFHAVNILIEPFALLLTAVPAILRNIVKMWLQKVHLYIDTRPQAVRNLKLGLELFFLYFGQFSRRKTKYSLRHLSKLHQNACPSSIPESEGQQRFLPLPLLI